MTRALAVLALCGCTGENPELEVESAAGGVEAYVRDVHPILEARCATLDCHGDPGRPLRLYAETGLRAADELRGAPITAAELEENARSIAAVDPGASPSDSMMLSKPLRGGVDHVGGDLWASPTDPQPACVLGWLAGESAAPAVTEACAAARPEVALPPL